MAIRTTGEMRAFLVSIMEDIKSGNISMESAKGIVDVSKAITDSFHAEVKVARTLQMAGLTHENLGVLPLGAGTASIMHAEVYKQMVESTESNVVLVNDLSELSADMDYD